MAVILCSWNPQGCVLNNHILRTFPGLNFSFNWQIERDNYLVLFNVWIIEGIVIVHLFCLRISHSPSCVRWRSLNLFDWAYWRLWRRTQFSTILDLIIRLRSVHVKKTDGACAARHWHLPSFNLNSIFLINDIVLLLNFNHDWEVLMVSLKIDNWFCFLVDSQVCQWWRQ